MNEKAEHKLTNHQERRSKIDANKLYAHVNGKTECSSRSHRGTHITQKTKPWLRPNCVAHHTCKHTVRKKYLLSKKNSFFAACMQKKFFSRSYLNTAIKMKVDPKYGMTVLVFFSSSWSRVLDANLATAICLKYPESS